MNGLDTRTDRDGNLWIAIGIKDFSLLDDKKRVVFRTIHCRDYRGPQPVISAGFGVVAWHYTSPDFDNPHMEFVTTCVHKGAETIFCRGDEKICERCMMAIAVTLIRGETTLNNPQAAKVQ